MRYFYSKQHNTLVAYDPADDTVIELIEVGSSVALDKKIMSDSTAPKKRRGGGQD